MPKSTGSRLSRASQKRLITSIKKGTRRVGDLFRSTESFAQIWCRTLRMMKLWSDPAEATGLFVTVTYYEAGRPRVDERHLPGRKTHGWEKGRTGERTNFCVITASYINICPKSCLNYEKFFLQSKWKKAPKVVNPYTLQIESELLKDLKMKSSYLW